MDDIQGPLWEGVLPGVLRRLFVGRKTGLLSFLRKDERRRVRFRGGNIISAESSVREDWMGEMLVRQGRLSRADLKRSVGFMLRDKRLLGGVLVEMGLLDDEGLEEAVAAHVKGVLSKVFSWSDGSYHFQEEPEDRKKEGDVTLRLSTGELILEAARSIEDPDVIRFNLGDLDRALALSNDPLLRFQRISLSPADGYVLSRVDGTLTARELGPLIPLSEEQFHRSLFGLLSAGVVDFLPGETEEEAAPASRHTRAAPAVAAPPEPAPGLAASPSGLMAESDPASAGEEPAAEEPAAEEQAAEEQAAEEEAAEEEAAEEEAAEEEASEEEASEEEASEEEASEEEAEEPTEEEPVSEAATERPPPGESAVEKTIIIPALGELPFEEMPTPPPGESVVEKTMMMPSLRDLPIGKTMPAPDSASEPPGPEAPPPGESAVEKTMMMPSLRDLPIGETMPLPPSASEAGDAEGRPEPSEVEKTLKLPPVDTRRLEVLAAYENLQARTHFEVLGVPPDATEAQVREAYFRLAKRFHPDVHHDPRLSDLREELEEVFGRLGEAYEVLCSPRLRARYERALAEQTEGPQARTPLDPEEEARLAADAIEKGAQSIGQERYWEAIQVLEPAISRAEGEARLRGRILLAQAYATHPNWVKQGEELLLAVLQDEPESWEALLLLARIYHGLGLRSRAVTMLRRVLDPHPDHEEAQALMAEIERTSPPPPGKGSGRRKKRLRRKPV